MTRDYRQVTAGIIQHLMWHGMRECGLFTDEEDFQYFLDKMSSIASHMNINVYAYCLLSTHVHMLAKPTQDDLPEFMQRLGYNYAVHFNQRHLFKGHVFSNRYWPIAVTDDRYLLTLSRYIHLNPRKAGLVSKPEDYAWSSCRDYLGFREASFIQTEMVLNHFRSGPQGHNYSIRAYRNYLREDTDGDGLPAIRRVNGAWVYDDTPIVASSEPSNESRTPSAAHLDRVLLAVNEKWADLENLGIARPGSGQAQRNAVLWLARRLAGMTWKEMAELLGMQPAAARIAAKRFQERLDADERLGELAKEMEDGIIAQVNASDGVEERPRTRISGTPPNSAQSF